MKIKTVGIRLLFFLLGYWIFILSIFVFGAKLTIAFIFFLQDGIFYFDWINNINSSFRTGIATGIPLGIGIWIMSRLKLKKDK